MDRPRDPAAPGSNAPQDGAGAPLVERRVNKLDRRSVTLRSLLKGGLTPRRRGGRRATDHEQPIDWHDPHLLLLALAMLVLSVADAFLTVTSRSGVATKWISWNARRSAEFVDMTTSAP